MLLIFEGKPKTRRAGPKAQQQVKLITLCLKSLEESQASTIILGPAIEGSETQYEHDSYFLFVSLQFYILAYFRVTNLME